MFYVCEYFRAGDLDLSTVCLAKTVLVAAHVFRTPGGRAHGSRISVDVAVAIGPEDWVMFACRLTALHTVTVVGH